MLINCNSCQKKFTVPDSAITKSGRLLQCGSCGNKWVQHPVKQKAVKEIKIKNLVKKKKREINLYSEEYLKKKHGLTIKSTSSRQDKEKNKTNFSFFNYLIIISVFIITFFGFLNLTKDITTEKYPFTVPYINYFFEIVDIIKITIFRLLN